MNNIYLHSPIILAESLEDMCPKSKKTALDLLHHRKYLTFTETGLTFLSAKEAMQTDMIYHGGSEAVCLYRQILGLPDRSIRTIRVNEIIEQIDNYDTLEDLVTILGWVDHCNESYSALISVNAPNPVCWAAENRLQKAVEKLQYNPEESDQFRKCVHHYDVDKGEECRPVPRKCLIDIGYFLQVVPEMPELSEEDLEDETEED